MKDIVTMVLLFIVCTGCLTMIIKFVTSASEEHFNKQCTIIKSPKPITPELQITGNGTQMDTIYIYKLEE